MRLDRRDVFSLIVTLLFAVTLPAKSSTYVVVVQVATMYSSPIHPRASSAISQAIYGTSVILLEDGDEWSYIQTEDHCKGWTQSSNLRLIRSGSGYATSGPTVRIKSLLALIYTQPSEDSPNGHSIPFGARLELIVGNKAAKTEWLQVRLPDDTAAWIRANDVVSPDPNPLSIAASIELARRFLGVPYLTGGSSSNGFDDSGFVQMVLRARGLNPPRDVTQQAEWTRATPVDRADLQPGDVIFFGDRGGKIQDAGIYVGDEQFIHASPNDARVEITHIADQPAWAQRIVACRRVK